MSQTENTSGGRLAPGSLWASAVVIASLIILQAGRFGGPSNVRADVVSNVSGTTALTFDSQSEQLLAIIDGRQELLFVYRVQARNSLELLRSYSLPDVFADARARATGTGRPR
jgi:hypothetical protein